MRYQPGAERKVGERATGAHKWTYAELATDEYPRPAQCCQRCGMVRILGSLHAIDAYNWYYQRGSDWEAVAPEPPCTPHA